MPPLASPARNDPVPLRIGLIGFGALARQLTDMLGPQQAEWIALVRDNSTSYLPAHVRSVTRLADFIAARPSAVVEVAGPSAVAEHAPPLLEAGIPVVLASVGALSDPSLCLQLDAAQRSTGTQMVLPAGAVGGLDYLRAISILRDARIRYTSRKPAAAWTNELAARGLDAENAEVVLFEGTPEEAAKLYPKNLNSALTIMLAVRPAPLTVRVVADPKAEGNTHEIEAVSSAGTAFMRFVNAPSPDNPKTSAVTALSLLVALRQLLEI